jgi:hypothetical protein
MNLQILANLALIKPWLHPHLDSSLRQALGLPELHK